MQRIEKKFDGTLDLEADKVEDICSDCKFDVLHKNPVGFSEFKSFSKVSITGDGVFIKGIGERLSFRNQFMKYLSDDRISSLAELTYIFNKKKADMQGFDLELIKAEFRQMFQDNASLLFKKVEEGGLGQAKMLQLFDVNDKKEFLEKVDDLRDSEIYGFIELL